MTEGETLKVTQADRDAAAACPKALWELCSCYGSGVSAYSGFQCGDCGGAGGQPPEWLLEMLARHRIEATRPDTSPAPESGEPVAWRWRYVHPGRPVHWTVCQTPRHSIEARPGFVAIEAEPLYLHRAPDSGDRNAVLDAAVNQNDAMRSELTYAGNLVSKLAQLMRVDQAHDDGTWPDLPGRIQKLITAALSTPEPVPDAVGKLVEALRECSDKLWVLRCNSRDPLDRESAERACNMATAALQHIGERA